MAPAPVAPHGAAGPMTPVWVIAEVATNHGGDVSLAKAFIDTFAPYVDAVKFQLTRAKHLRAGDPQAAWFRKAELTLDQWADVRAHAEKKGVGFLLTVYNANDVWELTELNLAEAKVGSGEAAETALERSLIRAGLKAVVSCGLTRPFDTPYWRSEWKGQVKFLGCVTRYPAPSGIAAATILAHPEMEGWSDHAVGLGEMQAAVAAGAGIIETHVQLPGQARPARSFEKTVDEMQIFRKFCQEDPTRFVGRWQE